MIKNFLPPLRPCSVQEKLKYGSSRSFDKLRTSCFSPDSFAVLKGGLRFITSLRRDKTGTSFSLTVRILVLFETSYVVTLV